jgi:hypothetical protein
VWFVFLGLIFGMFWLLFVLLNERQAHADTSTLIRVRSRAALRC